MNEAYLAVKTKVMAAVEEIARVKAPAADYLDALEEIKEEVGDWFEASMDAARDDVRRAEEDAT